MQTAEGYSAGIVDDHMDKLPACAIGILPVTGGDPVASSPETVQPVDFNVQRVPDTHNTPPVVPVATQPIDESWHVAAGEQQR